MVGSSHKMWSTREGNGKPLHHSCFENPMNSMKRQKRYDTEICTPRSVGAQYATGIEQRSSSRKKMKRLSQSRNKAQLWRCLGESMLKELTILHRNLEC